MKFEFNFNIKDITYLLLNVSLKNKLTLFENTMTYKSVSIVNSVKFLSIFEIFRSQSI